MGLRLRDFPSPQLTPGDVLAVMTHPADGSAVKRILEGEHAHWPLSNHLLAELVHSNRLLYWSKTKDAQSSNPRNQPKPIPRPGVEEELEDKAWTGDLMTMQDALEFQQRSREGLSVRDLGEGGV